MGAKGQSRGWMINILAACLLFATYFRYSVSNAGDQSKCGAVLRSGSWLDAPSSGRASSPFKKWQPEGCMLRNYNAKGIDSCLATSQTVNAVFVGDSTVREVFWATARKINATLAKAQEAKVEKHADITFSTGGATTLAFIWDPMLKSSQLQRYVEATIGTTHDQNPSAQQALLVVGGGLWFAKDSKHPVEDFKHAIDKVALPAEPPFHRDHRERPGANRVLFLPVQPPLYDSLDASHKSTLHKADIDAMNKYMRDLPELFGIPILQSFLEMVDNQPEAYQANGLHVTNNVADRQADIILNYRCNQEYQEYPFVGTCCYDYPLAWDQIGIWISGLILFMALGWFELQKWVGTASEESKEAMKPRLPLLRAILIFWAMLCYCYLADRTQLFEKVHKLYNHQDWFLFCAAIFLAGVFTIRRSATPTRPGQEKTLPVDQPFLSRDQTDEWKGWMQALILAYHYTGGSQVLWIYKIIRLLVASYLFMTGYGHAAYFYQKNDFSFKRVVAVNLRINFLSMILPWMTNADYMFYYFAPLVTYWYAVVWLTMRVKYEWNKNLTFFLTKIICACAITTFLHTQVWLFEPFFTIINFVFSSKWDAKEWLFRCALDQFIVYLGMVVAVLYIRGSKPPAPPPPPQDPMGTTAHTRPGMSPHLRQTGYFIGSAACIFIYVVTTHTRTTKASSNQLHTYVSPLAVLAFVHLRNCTRGMRNNYSTAYAWLGRISLETFILQYHLWLAADTKGLLSTGLFGNGSMGDGVSMVTAGMGFSRWTDCVLLGIIFVWTSLMVSDATGLLTGTIAKALFK